MIFPTLMLWTSQAKMNVLSWGSKIYDPSTSVRWISTLFICISDVLIRILTIHAYMCACIHAYIHTDSYIHTSMHAVGGNVLATRPPITFLFHTMCFKNGSGESFSDTSCGQKCCLCGRPTSSNRIRRIFEMASISKQCISFGRNRWVTVTGFVNCVSVPFSFTKCSHQKFRIDTGSGIWAHE